MKMMRKVCSVFLCVILLFGAVPVFSVAASGASVEMSDAGFAVVGQPWMLDLDLYHFPDGAKGVIRLSYNPKVLKLSDGYSALRMIKQVSDGVIEITIEFDPSEGKIDLPDDGELVMFSVIGKGSLDLSVTYNLKTPGGKAISPIQTVNSLTDASSYNENELPSFTFRDGTGYFYNKPEILYIAKTMTVSELRAAYTGDPSTLLIEDYKGIPLADNAPIATGTTLVTVYHGKMVSTASVVLLGDCDADGKITSADASAILQIAVGVYPGIEQDPSSDDDANTDVRNYKADNDPKENEENEYELLYCKQMAADVDCDGEVSTSDARKILRCASGIEKYDDLIADFKANSEFYDHLNTVCSVYVEMKRNYSAPEVMYNRDYFDSSLVNHVQVVKKPFTIGNLVVFGRLGLLLDLWMPTAENAEKLRAELASRSDIESVTVESAKLNELNYYAKARTMLAKR